MAAGDGIEIRETAHEGVVVVAPLGRVDSNTAGTFERALSPHLAREGTRLVVDLAAVDYISSAGLSVLLVAAKKARARGGRLVLCAMTKAVRQTFDYAGFVPLFAIEPTREGALTRAGAP